MRGDELGEDDELGRRVPLAAAHLIDDGQQGGHLGIQTDLGAAGQFQQLLDLGHLAGQLGLVHHPANGQQVIEHGLGILIGRGFLVEFAVAAGRVSHAKRLPQRGQPGMALAQRRVDRFRAAGHQALEQDHQEAERPVAPSHGPVVVVPDVLGHRLVQLPLQSVFGTRAIHRVNIGDPLLEQPPPLRIHRRALARAPDHRRHPVGCQIGDLVEAVGIKQVEQMQETPGVALVRRGGQQQEDRHGRGQRFAHAIAGGLGAVGLFAQLVGLVEDHYVPAGPDDVLEDAPVMHLPPLALGRGEVRAQALRLDEVQAGDHLVVDRPQVGFLAVQLTKRRHHGAVVDDELLAEFLGELVLPLPGQPGRGDHQAAVGLPAELQLLINHRRFDGLAQADLIGDHDPGPDATQHEVHGQHLVRQRRHAEIGRRKHALLRHQRLQLVRSQGCDEQGRRHQWPRPPLRPAQQPAAVRPSARGAPARPAR